MKIFDELKLLQEDCKPRKHSNIKSEYIDSFIGALEVWECRHCGLSEQWNVFYDGNGGECYREKEVRAFKDALYDAFDELKKLDDEATK